MKDATGELSMTAVAVVAIAAISVLFTTLIWPTIRKNILRSTYCSQAFNCGTGTTNGMVNCSYCEDDNCTNVGTIQCQQTEGLNNGGGAGGAGT